MIAIKPFRLNSVQTSFFGQNALELLSEEISKLGFKKALIVTDNFLYENGIAAAVALKIENAGARFGLFNKVQANPTVAIVEKCTVYAKAIQADCLVAVGGGSAIDTAKAVGILYTNGGDIRQYEGQQKSSHAALPIIAVNTTAGTGSEVTSFYIITDEIKHTKLCMVDNNCIPIIAVNDTTLMVDMPPALTAATGMDALTHCIEAVLTKNSNPLSDKDALWAISVIQKYLPISYKNGNDMKARDYMALGANVAGMAFSNSGLGLVHAMAHALGGFYNLPHGVCNAILLPYVMEFNAEHCPEAINSFCKIANAMGINSNNPKDKTHDLIKAVKALSLNLGIPKALSVFSNINTGDFEYLAEMAIQDPCVFANPVMPTKLQIEQLYLNAYNGK